MPKYANYYHLPLFVCLGFFCLENSIQNLKVIFLLISTDFQGLLW